MQVPPEPGSAPGEGHGSHRSNGTGESVKESRFGLQLWLTNHGDEDISIQASALDLAGDLLQRLAPVVEVPEERYEELELHFRGDPLPQGIVLKMAGLYNVGSTKLNVNLDCSARVPRLKSMVRVRCGSRSHRRRRKRG